MFERLPMMFTASARTRWLTAGVIAGWVGASSQTADARAARAESDSRAHARRDLEARDAHAEEPSNLLGFKAGPMLVLEPSHDDTHSMVSIPAGFAGVFFERTLVHDWLELEVTVPVGMAEVEGRTVLFVPLDIHFKKPFHPLPWLAPYVGAGPALDIFVHEAKVYAGGSFTAGAYIWPGHQHVGVDVELDYNVLAFEGSAAHEMLFACGPVWQF